MNNPKSFSKKLPETFIEKFPDSFIEKFIRSSTNYPGSHHNYPLPTHNNKYTPPVTPSHPSTPPVTPSPHNNTTTIRNKYYVK